MRGLPWLLLVVLVSCGSDSSGDAGNGSIDGPTSDDDGGGGDDGGAEPDAPASLGELCATTAPDGSPAACTGGTICCVSTGGTFCTFPEDCSGGPGFVMCDMTSDCFSGRICCSVPGMQFCTKESTCLEYGGTVLP